MLSWRSGCTPQKDREITVALYANLIVDQSKEISGIVLHLIDLTEQRNLEVQFSQSQNASNWPISWRSNTTLIICSQP